MRPTTPEPTPSSDDAPAALAARPRRPDPAAAIRRDLLTLAGLPGEDRIRAIYGLDEGLPETRNLAAAA